MSFKQLLIYNIFFANIVFIYNNIKNIDLFYI